jgi:hypothetical protein
MEIYKVSDKLKNDPKTQKWWMQFNYTKITKSRKRNKIGSDYANLKDWGKHYKKNPNNTRSQHTADKNGRKTQNTTTRNSNRQNREEETKNKMI